MFCLIFKSFGKKLIMKKTFALFVLSIFALSFAYAQTNWAAYPPSAPLNGFWDMDTLNGKLYISTGLIQEYNGASYSVTSNYNNSSNTPNKTKSCVRNISGKLYAGAKDFNSSGQGTIHFLSANTWSLQQTTNFQYNGSNKIRGFAEINSQLYTCGLFTCPGSTNFYNVAKWDGTDWVNVGRNFGQFPATSEVFDMLTYQNKIFLTEGNAVYSNNGSIWDSIVSPYNTNNVYPIGSVRDLQVYNNSLYISGLLMTNSTTQSLLLKYNGTSVTSILAPGTYTAVGKMGVVGNKLLFVAKKTVDDNTYLVSYDGTSFNEVIKLADYGDFTFSPGNENYNFSKIFEYQNNIIVGGNFSKINGQTISSLAYLPSSATSSIKETKLGVPNFNIYPNPAKSKVELTYSVEQNFELIITNLLGTTVKEIEPGTNSIQLDLNSGIYFISIKENGKLFNTKKLIIE